MKSVVALSHATLRPEPSHNVLATATLLSLENVNKQLDHPYGMCWPRPLYSQAILVPCLPISLVERWSISVANTRAWGLAHAPRQCPDYANHGPCSHSGCRIRLYADGVARGSQFPPIAVIYRPDNPDLIYGSWLVDDGLHRISALKLLGRNFVSAVVASDTLAALYQASSLTSLPESDSIEIG